MEQKIDSEINSWGLKADKKRMFGGMCWLLNGNMMCAVLSGGMMIAKVPDEQREYMLALDDVHQAEMNGRVMKNWVMFDGSVVTRETFALLLDVARDFALSLKEK